MIPMRKERDGDRPGVDFYKDFDLPCKNPMDYTSIPYKPNYGMEVTVCVTNYNSSLGQIFKCLQAIDNQYFPKDHYEVVVVDDKSNEFFTDEIVNFANKRGIKLAVVPLKRTRSGNDTHTLNVAFRIARGKRCVVNQTHVLMGQGVLESARRHGYHHPECAVVPVYYDINNKGEYHLFYDWLNEACISYNTEHLRRVFGRDESIHVDPPDVDLQLALRDNCGTIYILDKFTRAYHVVEHEQWFKEPRMERKPGTRGEGGRYDSCEHWGTIDNEEIIYYSEEY